MANTVVIALVLAVAYSMTTATTFQDLMGKRICHYDKTSEDCVHFGECLKDNNYTLDDPCDHEQIFLANISTDTLEEAMVCSWEKSGYVKEDGKCDVDKQMEAIEKRMKFDNEETKPELIKAIRTCNEQYEGKCITALLCGVDISIKICYPKYKLDRENQNNV